jgi:hypothetical protein
MAAHSPDLATPAETRDYAGPSGGAELLDFLARVAGTAGLQAEQAGLSLEGRPIPMITVGPPDGLGVFLLARQHGDEPAGTEALLRLARDLALGPLRPLLADLRVTLLPLVNPDGAMRNVRESASGENLNRGHTRLTAPELRALHRAFHLRRPAVTVDLHEYNQDQEAWRTRGYRRAGDLLIGAATHLNVAQRLRDLADAFVPRMGKAVESAGLSQGRYLLDGPPPLPMRTSTLRAYDGRNGLAVHQCLSYIVESGRRNGKGDLARRTEAHYRAVRALLEGVADEGRTVARAVEEARAEAGNQPLCLAQTYLPIPTAERVLVERIADGVWEALPLHTLNALAVPILAVPRPQAYWIAEEALARLEPSLAGHAIAWDRPPASDANRTRRFRIVPRTDKAPPAAEACTAGAPPPSGAARICLRQFSGTMAGLLLEPGSADGALANGLIAPDADGLLPVWREERDDER